MINVCHSKFLQFYIYIKADSNNVQVGALMF